VPFLALAFAFALTLEAPVAQAEDVRLGFSNRFEGAWSRPDKESGVSDWLDARAFGKRWNAHVRLRVRLATEALGDSVGLEQRDITFGTRHLEVTGGTYYETIGRGLLLRAYENRFVTLSRVSRAFSLDRDIDGVRMRARTSFLDVVAISGRPRITPVNGGGASRESGQRIDLLQTISGDARFLDQAVSLGGAVMRADRKVLARQRDPNPRQMLRSVRGSGMWRAFTGYAEWADIRWESETPGLPYGRALYGEVTAAVGGLGASLEYKDYDSYSFPYAEPPTLVRTQQSILLNASTHVLKPTESGFQFEGLYSSGLEHTATLNLSRATSRFGRREFDFSEVYLEERYEGNPLLGFVFGDWAEDEFTGDKNRWTLGGSGSLEIVRDYSLFTDLEFQVIDPSGDNEDFNNGVAQMGAQRAGLWSLALTYRWTSADSFGERTNWFSGFLALTLSDVHQISIFAGTRAPGLVCSGGFCFDAPEFDGVEVRLLSAL